MYNIKVLEEKWRLYNKKRYRFFYFLALLLLVFLGWMFFYTKQAPSNKGITKKVIPAPSTIKQVSAVEQVQSIKKVSTIKKVPIVATEVVKHVYPLLLNSPILDLELEQKEIAKEKVIDTDSVEDENTEEMIPTLPIVHDIPVIDDPIQKKNHKSKYKMKPLAKVKKNVHHIVKRKKKRLNIIKSSNKLRLKEVARRFKRYHNVEDALFLAKTYYKQEKYLKSEYWALETNKMDYNIEDSWILFAKSKIKLGQKREAIGILQKYVQQSHSKKAKKLLLKLKY